MNDIFKLFKKRAQAGKSTNIQDVIKDLNEKEQSEMMSEAKFDRNNKSYLSISKSGRLKSKKSQNSRALQEDLFAPSTAVSIDISTHLSPANTMTKYDSSRHVTHNKPIYDQHSDNADSSTSSTSSSFRSSYDEIPATTNLKAPNRLANSTYNQYQHNSGFANSNYPYNHHNSTNLNNTNNYSKTSSTNNNSSNLFKRFY